MDAKVLRDVRHRIAILTALLGVTLYLTHERILLLAGDFLVVQDRIEPVDVIHVIAGEDHRIDYAIHLYQRGLGKLLFFTGGWCPSHHRYHGQHGRERALAQGVPPGSVAVDEEQAFSTYAEILRVKDFIQRSGRPARSVIAVSDPHHMRRARWAYQKVLGDRVKLFMSPVPFGASPYRRRWWEERTSTRMVKEEYLKFAYYRVRHQFRWGPLEPWLASLDKNW